MNPLLRLWNWIKGKFIIPIKVRVQTWYNNLLSFFFKQQLKLLQQLSNKNIMTVIKLSTPILILLISSIIGGELSATIFTSQDDLEAQARRIKVANEEYFAGLNKNDSYITAFRKFISIPRVIKCDVAHYELLVGFIIGALGAQALGYLITYYIRSIPFFSIYISAVYKCYKRNNIVRSFFSYWYMKVLYRIGWYKNLDINATFADRVIDLLSIIFRFIWEFKQFPLFCLSVYYYIHYINDRILRPSYMSEGIFYGHISPELAQQYSQIFFHLTKISLDTIDPYCIVILIAVLLGTAVGLVVGVVRGWIAAGKDDNIFKLGIQVIAGEVTIMNNAEIVKSLEIANVSIYDFDETAYKVVHQYDAALADSFKAVRQQYLETLYLHRRMLLFSVFTYIGVVTWLVHPITAPHTVLLRNAFNRLYIEPVGTKWWTSDDERNKMHDLLYIKSLETRIYIYFYYYFTTKSYEGNLAMKKAYERLRAWHEELEKWH